MKPAEEEIKSSHLRETLMSITFACLVDYVTISVFYRFFSKYVVLSFISFLCDLKCSNQSESVDNVVRSFSTLEKSDNDH